MSDFIVDQTNIDALKARILVVENTFIDNSVSVEHATDYGHIHLSEIINYANKFENKAILLIHFSARYPLEVWPDNFGVCDSFYLQALDNNLKVSL
ncbi:hypothetical protein REPUB_Repub08aG0074800 [Reevesia pubescens]